MSKGLEALEHLVDGNLNEVNYYRQFCDSTTYIMKDKEVIEKELKALEIIINTLEMDKEDLFYDSEEDKYYFIGYEISKENFDLLKEVIL